MEYQETQCLVLQTKKTARTLCLLVSLVSAEGAAARNHRPHCPHHPGGAGGVPAMEEGARADRQGEGGTPQECQGPVETGVGHGQN